jgi:predicted GNAT superfamily acetyltransferase
LVVTSILASPESTVVSIPSAVQVILEGREFEAIAEDGRSVGTVKVRGGRSWGYDHFLASRRHQRGDVLTVTFDLSRRQSTLAASERPVANE